MISRNSISGRQVVVVAILLVTVIAFLVQCSDDSPVQSGANQIDIRLKISSPEMMQQIQLVRITVTPVGGGDSIVVVWPVVNGQYLGVIPGVPAGDFLVITEALASDGRVVYRGETVVTVVPGEIADAAIEMQPVGAVVKLTPRHQGISAGGSFAVDIVAHGLPNTGQLACRLYYDSDLLGPDSVQPGSLFYDGVVIQFSLSDTLSADPPYYALVIEAPPPLTPIVPESGSVRLATVYFSSGIPGIGSPLDLVTEITIDSLNLTDVEGVEMDPAEVYCDLAVITFTDIGIDLIPPAPVFDLKLDSASQSTAYLSWTAPGDDGYIGTVSTYEIRHSSTRITSANWSAAQLVNVAPFVLPAGSKQVLAATGITMTDTVYFAVRSRDNVGNQSALSNIAVGAAPDITAPGSIADLDISNQTIDGVTLTWTAPGDNALRGIASQYDIRYANSTITDANWDLATAVAGEPTPQTPGTMESMTVSVVNNSVLHFAIRTGDEVPNWSALSNVVMSTPADTVRPNNVGDFIITDVTGTTVSFRWSAQGDDHQTGLASLYDLRYDTTSITEASFAAATPVAGLPSPQTPGTFEYFTVIDLNSDTRYYFAIKIGDDALNWSTLSSVPTTITLDITAPGTITDLSAGDYTASSVALTWTATGDSDDQGTATLYDLRWARTEITEGNWASATAVSDLPTPSVAGAAETQLVSSLPTAGTYYFGIKASDEAGNEGLLSNNAVLEMVVVTIPDAAIEAAIRAEISIPFDVLVEPDLVAVYSLDVGDSGVLDLTGLEYCPNLTFLQIGWNSISDLSPIMNLANLEHLAMASTMVDNFAILSGLTGLSFLDASDSRYAGSYEPLSTLTWLDSLVINDDGLVNVDFLQPMGELVYLDLEFSPVADISPLAGCPLLSYLSMRYTYVADLTPLTTLIELDTLYFSYTNVADLLPLVSNLGLGSGDYLDVDGCPLSGSSWEFYIPTLRARGVTVFYGE